MLLGSSDWVWYRLVSQTEDIETVENPSWSVQSFSTGPGPPLGPADFLPFIYNLTVVTVQMTLDPSPVAHLRWDLSSGWLGPCWGDLYYQTWRWCPFFQEVQDLPAPQRLLISLFNIRQRQWKFPCLTVSQLVLLKQSSSCWEAPSDQLLMVLLEMRAVLRRCKQGCVVRQAQAV